MRAPTDGACRRGGALANLWLGDHTDGRGRVVANGARHREAVPVVPHAGGPAVGAGGRHAAAHPQDAFHLGRRVGLVVDCEVEGRQRARIARLLADDDGARVARVGDPHALVLDEARDGRGAAHGSVNALGKVLVHADVRLFQRVARIVCAERCVAQLLPQRCEQVLTDELRDIVAVAAVAVVHAKEARSRIAAQRVDGEPAVLVDLCNCPPWDGLAPPNRLAGARGARRLRLRRLHVSVAQPAPRAGVLLLALILFQHSPQS